MTTSLPDVTVNRGALVGLRRNNDLTNLVIGDSFSVTGGGVGKARVPYGMLTQFSLPDSGLTCLFCPAIPNSAFGLGGTNNSGRRLYQSQDDNLTEQFDASTGFLLPPASGLPPKPTALRSLPLGGGWHISDTALADVQGVNNGLVFYSYRGSGDVYPLDDSLQAQFPGVSPRTATVVGWIEDPQRQDTTQSGVILRVVTPLSNGNPDVRTGGGLRDLGGVIPTTTVKELTGAPRAYVIDEGPMDGDLRDAWCLVIDDVSEVNAAADPMAEPPVPEQDLRAFVLGAWVYGSAPVVGGRRHIHLGAESMQLSDWERGLPASDGFEKSVDWESVRSLLDTAPAGVNSGKLVVWISIAAEVLTPAEYAFALRRISEHADALADELGYDSALTVAIVPLRHRLGDGTWSTSPFNNFLEGARQAFAGGANIAAVSVYHATDGTRFEGANIESADPATRDAVVAAHDAWIGLDEWRDDWTAWTYKLDTTVDLRYAADVLKMDDPNQIHPGNEATAAFASRIVELILESVDDEAGSPDAQNDYVAGSKGGVIASMVATGLLHRSSRQVGDS